MNQTVIIQNSVSSKETREQFKHQLAEYVAQQPRAIQAAHRWMVRLQAAAMGITLAVFVVALYLSIMWKSINPLLIPIAWFVFAASFSPAMSFSGLDSIITRAFPTPIMPIGSQKLVTGTGAVWIGAGFIVLALVVAAFWGAFAYATWTQNWMMLQPLISFMGVLMAIAMVFGMLQKGLLKLQK